MHIKLTHQNAARRKQRQAANRLHFQTNFQLTGVCRNVQNHSTKSSVPSALWERAGLRFLLLGCFVASFFNATAGYIPVPLTGFNVDAVCNGAGTAQVTTSGLGTTANAPSGFDNSGYWLVDSSFNPGLGTPTGGAMPPSLNINSAITPGLFWTLQSYNSNNALRIGNATTITTDSLLFPTGTSAMSAGELYMLYTNIQFTAGDSVFVTVNFTDGSSQAPIAKALPNWFATSGFTPAKAIGGRYNGNSNVWDNQGTAAGPMLYQHQIDILPANYAKKIRSIKFAHKLPNNFLYIFGITANPPCTGKPSAGAVKPMSVCPNVNFTLQLDGASQASNLSYLWQQSTNGTVWSNVAASSTQPTVTYNISAPTYFRCVVTCNNSNLSDTSAPYLANLAPFYLCYCASTSNPASTTYGGNVGNFTVKTQPANVTVLNNGNAAPLTYNTTATNHYTNYTNLAPAVMYRDSTYKFFVTEISNTYFATGTNYAVVYLDFNRDGVYDISERVLYQNIGSNTTQQATGTFTIPDTARYGLTGMRVIVFPLGSAVNPCGTYSYGETEDYLADLRLPPCDGPSNPGVALASASSMCAGYDILLTDTTYEKQRSSLSRIWQRSTDFGSSWTNIAGGNDKDTMSVMFTGATSYRLKMVCTITGDSTFSNIINVALKPAYKCYCYSMATGGVNDSTDFGGFTIRNFVAADNGPHVLNPKATKGRTDYTDLGPLELFIDSTYKVEMYQSMSSAKHADARVTMFIDYNNNMQYDIPAERIVLNNDVATLSNWYLNNTFTVPSAAVRNTPTGMRIIINNNLAPNTPSDEACGAYTSGETEDFVVVIRKGLPSTTGVENMSNLQNLQLYPNPTNGRFTVSFNADKAVKDLNVVVTNITSQRIYHEAHNNIGVIFSKEIDLSKEARGVYFVTITADGEKTVRMVTVQ